MGAEIDSLEINIQASAAQLDKSLESLVVKLRQISTQLGITSNSVGHFSGAVNNLTAAMTGFKSSGVKGSDFTRIVSGLNRLSTIDSGGINRASSALTNLSRQLSGLGNLNFDSQGLLNIANSLSKFGSKTATNATANLPIIRRDLIGFVQGLNGIGTLNFDIAGLSNLVGSISRLGGKSATNSIPNIQGLGTALKGLITTLSTAPHVSQNVIQLTNALANLAGNGSRVSSASRAMQNGLNRYSLGAKTATRHTKSLASSIGMFYAKCFLAIRAVRALWRAISSSMDYVETVNYFDAAWGQVASKAVGDWKKSGYESAEAFYNSFSERAKELTGKMTGFQPDAEGNLIATNMPALGLDPNKLMNYQATFGQMASSMGVTSENALKLSNALTMIGADLASVKNKKFEDVWNDMASGMVGMSRTLDKYGVNIRNVNLQEKLNELGIKAKINTLNQQDKALLRTIILLDSTKYAWGDMARTISQPANSLRLLQANFANLARTLGNLFLPMVTKVLPYINALVISLQRLFSWVGSLLGIKASNFTSSVGSAAVDMGDFANDADDAAGSLDDATGAAKKLKSTLASWDEIENRNSKDDAGAGGGANVGGDGGLLDEAFNDAIAEYQKAWDEAFANMKNNAQQLADSITASFKQIWELAEPARTAIKQLWDEGLSKLGDFSLGALNSLWNDYLKPIGKWMLSDNSGLPRFFNITNDLLNKIKWDRLLDSLKKFNTALQRPTKFVWTALMDFYEEFLQPIGVWVLGEGLPTFLDATSRLIDDINWEYLNEALRDFWRAIEPYAENIGDNLVWFYDKVVVPFTGTTVNLFIEQLDDLASSLLLLNAVFGDQKVSDAEKLKALSGGLDSLKHSIERFPLTWWIGKLLPGSDEVQNAAEEFQGYLKEIEPWLTAEKWSNLYDSIKTAISKKWDETVTIWREGLTNWWTYDVQPWFTVDKWSELYNTIKTSLKKAWDNTKEQWKEDLSEWWTSDVHPWFTAEKWTAALSGIKTGFSNAFKGAIEAVKSQWNEFAIWLNNKLSFEMPEIKNPLTGGILMGGGTIQIGEIPTFSTGGFPEDGLFMANHNELIGRFSNGKTTVANNEQITKGISLAVSEANTELIFEMRRQNELLEAINRKELHIGDNEVYSAVKREDIKEYRKTMRPSWAGL